MLFTLLKKIDEQVTFAEITQHASKLSSNPPLESGSNRTNKINTANIDVNNNHYLLSEINKPRWLL